MTQRKDLMDLVSGIASGKMTAMMYGWRCVLFNVCVTFAGSDRYQPPQLSGDTISGQTQIE